MITVAQDREVIRSGAFREAHFKLAQNAHIFKILRDGIYSDKVLAVIREYWANARDEHAKLGTPELPVRITMPNDFEPYLKIRDFGKGLTRDEVEDIYISYGTSTKTASNDFIGALGIGSKSAFCYTSAFQVTSYLNGKADVYSCYIDETEMGKIAFITSNKTDEPNGVEISVPVNTSDFSLFQDKAKQLFMFAQHRPTIIARDFEFSEPQTIIQKNNWYVLARGSASFCVMGDIPYAFDRHAFKSTYPSVISALRKEEYVRQEIEVEEGTRTTIDVDAVIKYPKILPSEIVKLVDNYSLALRFQIGDLEIAASREALSYRTKTILAIYDALTAVIADIGKEVKAEIDGCKCLYDAKKLYVKYVRDNDSYSLQSLLRTIGGVNISWNGEKISDSMIRWRDVAIPYPPAPPAPPKLDANGNPVPQVAPPAPPKPLQCDYYHRGSKMQMRITEDMTGINVGDIDWEIIVNDTGIERGLRFTMHCLMPRSTYHGQGYYVFNCRTKENLDAIIAHLTLVGVPFTRLSQMTIPKPEVSTQYCSSPKYSKKLFTYKGDHHSKGSENWEIADIDPEDQDGIYVVIDRYYPVFSGNTRKFSDLDAIIRFIEAQEGSKLTVYGIKVGHEKIIPSHWTSLEKYSLELTKKLMNGVNFEQLHADYHHMEELLSTAGEYSFRTTENRSLLELTVNVQQAMQDPQYNVLPDHKYFAYMKPVSDMVANHKIFKSHNQVVAVMDILGAKVVKDDVKPTCDVIPHLHSTVLTTYPLMKHLVREYRNAYDSEKLQMIQAVTDYIILKS